MLGQQQGAGAGQQGGADQVGPRDPGVLVEQAAHHRPDHTAEPAGRLLHAEGGAATVAPGPSCHHRGQRGRGETLADDKLEGARVFAHLMTRASQAMEQAGERMLKRRERVASRPDDLSPDAEVTVTIYRGGKVEASHALAKGQLNEAAIKAILADTAKILD